MKMFSVVLLIVLLLTSCNQNTERNDTFNTQDTLQTTSIPASTTNEPSSSSMKPTDDISQDIIESAKKYEFLTSFDGCEYRRKMLMFAKDFFNNNEDKVKKHLIAPENIVVDFSYNDGRDYSDIEFILIKFDNIDTSSNTAHAQLEYKWENTEMYYYLDITMKKVNDSWMVVNYFVEG